MTSLCFEYYNANDGWRWRLKSRNGRIIADGAEAYKTRSGLRAACWRLNESILFAGVPLDCIEVEDEFNV